MKDEVKARSAFLDQFLPATAEPAEEQGLTYTPGSRLNSETVT